MVSPAPPASMVPLRLQPQAGLAVAPLRHRAAGRDREARLLAQERFTACRRGRCEGLRYAGELSRRAIASGKEEQSMDEIRDSFRSSLGGWLRGTAAGLGTLLLALAGAVLTIGTA